MRTYLLLIPMLLITLLLHAQDEKKVFERYADFNLKRFEGNNADALDLGVALLPSVDSLPAKSRVNFYNSMGKLYENNRQPERAIPYYEKVTAAVPNYYVAHRALGYIYLPATNDIFTQLSAAKKGTPAYIKLKAAYKASALKAVKHLEVAQACDPSDDTLDIIKTLYQNMGDTAGLSTLNERLAKMGKDCLDILSDD